MPTPTHAVSSALTTLFLVGPFVVCVAALTHGVGTAPRAEVAVEEPAASPWAGGPKMPELGPTQAEPSPTQASAIPLALWSAQGVVLSHEAPSAWARGSWIDRYADDDSEMIFARKPADLSALPTELAGVAGTLLDLYGPQGKVCTARIDALHVVAMRDAWAVPVTPEFDEDGDGKLDPPERDRLRLRVFAEEARWLVGEVSPVAGECRAAVFGRSASLPAPSLWTQVQGEDARSLVLAEKLAAFEAGASLELRRPYEEYAAEVEQDSGIVETQPTWAEFYRDNLTVSVYRDGAGVPAAAHLIAGDLSASCGMGFGATFIRSIPLGQKPLTYDGSSPPLLFVDIAGDGRMHAITDEVDGFVWFADDGDLVASSALPYHGCSC